LERIAHPTRRPLGDDDGTVLVGGVAGAGGQDADGGFEVEE
jgi:hypothetical protein